MTRGENWAWPRRKREIQWEYEREWDMVLSQQKIVLGVRDGDAGHVTLETFGSVPTLTGNI